MKSKKAPTYLGNYLEKYTRNLSSNKTPTQHLTTAAVVTPPPAAVLPTPDSDMTHGPDFDTLDETGVPTLTELYRNEYLNETFGLYEDERGP